MSARWVGMDAEWTHFEVLPAGAEPPEGAATEEGEVLRKPTLVISSPDDALMVGGDLAELTWRLRKALADAERLAEGHAAAAGDGGR
jgi:hypothetical protein